MIKMIRDEKTIFTLSASVSILEGVQLRPSCSAGSVAL